jgi:hypothetical protein
MRHLFAVAFAAAFLLGDTIVPSFAECGRLNCKDEVRIIDPMCRASLNEVMDPLCLTLR